jgi:hypothetical protein
MQWKEELQIVPHEMEWTCGSFHHLHDMWKGRADQFNGDVTKQGHYSYALKQAGMWKDWELKARLSFSEVLDSSGSMVVT